MNIAELITECGVDRVGVQYLDQCADTLNMKGGATYIKFGTEQRLTPDGTEKLGIIVWLDRNDAKAALAKTMSARQGLGHPGAVANAVLDEVAFAIEQARCPGREGPFGGYDYGHNTDFYGPEPDGGRYVVRDFRDFRSPDWGKWVHQTACEKEHEQALLRLTGRHIAEAAISAYAKAMETQSAMTEGHGPKDDSAARQGLPEPHPDTPS